MKKPTPAKELITSKAKFQYAIKYIEKDWDFMGWKKKKIDLNWKIVESKDRGLQLCIWWFGGEEKAGEEAEIKRTYFDFATVLCSLSARRKWFGKYWEAYSAVMFSQGEPVQMLNWLVKFLKGKSNES